LRDWEQGRSAPDQPARAYLTVIAHDPEGVRRALLSRRPVDRGSCDAAVQILPDIDAGHGGARLQLGGHQMANTTRLPPGTPTPRSGIYERQGPRGGSTGEQADSTRGNPLPPAPKGQTWTLVKPAHHKENK